jgi:N-ethylmaleimide reductase
MDGLAFGFHQPEEPMTLAEFRAHCDGIIIGICGYTEEDAEKRLAEDVMDIAAFGRPFITNPDLVTRLPNNHPLTPFEDMSKWHTSGPEGYIDYQPYGQ